METEPNFSSGADPVLYNKSRILHYYNFLLRFLISFLSYIKYKYKYRAAWHGTENLKLVFQKDLTFKFLIESGFRSGIRIWIRVENFRILDPDPYNISYGSRITALNPTPTIKHVVITETSGIDRQVSVILTLIVMLLQSSVVDPDPYWIRIQELLGSGSTHANIG